MLCTAAGIICMLAWGTLPAQWHSAEPTSVSISVGLAPLWQGRLIIEKLTLDLPRSAEAQGIMLVDSNDRPWLVVDWAKAVFPEGALNNAQITIENPHLLIYIRNEEIDTNLPSMAKAGPGGWLKYLENLKPASVVVKNLGFTLVAEPNSSASIYGINAFTVRAGSSYRAFGGLDPNIMPSQPNHLGEFEAVLDPATSQAGYYIRSEIDAVPVQSSVVFDAIGSRWFRSLQGIIYLSARASGCVDDLTSLFPTGSGTIADATLYEDGGRAIATNCTAAIALLPGQLIIEQIYASLYDGVASGQFFYSNPAGDKGTYGGFFRVRDVSFAKLMGPESARSGKASFTIRFTRRSNEPNSLKGVTAIYLTRADLGSVPVITQIFDFLKLEKADPLVFSDVAALFSMKGTMLNFDTARVSSRLAAIEFEKGLIADYHTKWVSGHAIVVPFAAINRMLVRIPLFGRLVTLTNQVSRVQVQGYWDKPGAKLISKDVFKDLSQGTWDFLRGVSRTQGKIPPKAFESLEKLPE
ncbi:MAG: hypothetical protein A2Y07_11140 [Planctomycetes bacterium GWF2_50_10]|nr:MAG: hypothetical protein A2Y07_11140 [Planctomycetes bacterium GWF2_50_10]